jgi:hypothetical protein
VGGLGGSRHHHRRPRRLGDRRVALKIAVLVITGVGIGLASCPTRCHRSRVLELWVSLLDHRVDEHAVTIYKHYLRLYHPCVAFRFSYKENV